jgi:hypothetical protein
MLLLVGMLLGTCAVATVAAAPHHRAAATHAPRGQTGFLRSAQVKHQTALLARGAAAIVKHQIRRRVSGRSPRCMAINYPGRLQRAPPSASLLS